MHIADTLSRAPIDDNCQEKSLKFVKLKRSFEELDNCSDIDDKRVCDEMITKIQQATA